MKLTAAEKRPQIMRATCTIQLALDKTQQIQLILLLDFKKNYSLTF